MRLEKKLSLAAAGLALFSLFMPWAYNNVGDMSIPYYTPVYPTALLAFSPLLGAALMLSFAGGLRRPSPFAATITAILFWALSAGLMTLYAVMFVTRGWTPVGYVLQVISLLIVLCAAATTVRRRGVVDEAVAV